MKVILNNDDYGVVSTDIEEILEHITYMGYNWEIFNEESLFSVRIQGGRGLYYI